jgi:Xaa-Pro aminopeptidase
MSGFTGSAGCAVVTLDEAALATDGRYFSQAASQLDDNWTLLKQGLQDVPTWQEWAADHSAGGKTVAVDPTLLPAASVSKLVEKITKAGGANLLPLDNNLVDIVWGNERPAQPSQPVIVLGEEFAGKSVQDKIADLRKELQKKRSPGFVVTLLDEVAWLFNLRGSDIPYNPVFFSYAMITTQSSTLYVDESKLSDTVRDHLKSNGIDLKPYSDITADCQELYVSVKKQVSDTTDPPPANFLISDKASWAIQIALGGDSAVDDMRSPIGDAKAIKNDTEIAGMRACHVRDGAALIEYFAWLEDQLVVKKAHLDEVEGADKLQQIREKQELFVGLSFSTISGTGSK